MEERSAETGKNLGKVISIDQGKIEKHLGSQVKKEIVMAKRAGGVLVVCIALLAVVAGWSRSEDLTKETVDNMKTQEKIALLKHGKFENKSEREMLAKYFEEHWEKLEPSVLAAFCEAMGRVKAEEAVSLLVEHMDFFYYGEPEDVDLDKLRTITEDRFALDALIAIGKPSLLPGTERTLNAFAEEKDRHKLAFWRQGLQKLAVGVLGKSGARDYIHKLRIRQVDILKQLVSVDNS